MLFGRKCFSMDSRRQPGRKRQLAPTKGLAVLIVHPDDELRRAVRAVVNAAPGFDPVGDAATAEEALEQAVALRPPLALVAIDMPGIDGFETSERLVEALPATTVVLLRRSTGPGDQALARARAVEPVPRVPRRWCYSPPPRWSPSHAWCTAGGAHASLRPSSCG
jgi:CheY-like chemotaxis protein